MKLFSISAILITWSRMLQMDTTAMIINNRKWEMFSVNLEKLFEENITEVALFHARPFTCALVASSLDFANVACIKNSSCVYLYVSRVFWYEGPQTDDIYKCYVSHYCKYDGAFVAENESVTANEAVSNEERTFACGRMGLIDTGMPVPATNCSAPFTQFSWGCVYGSNFTGTNIDAKRHCQSYGANLASPKTASDSLAMMEYFFDKYTSPFPRFWVAIVKVNGEWQWPENGRKANASEWVPTQPSGDGIVACLMDDYGNSYGLNDAGKDLQYLTLCHVWNVY